MYVECKFWCGSWGYSSKKDSEQENRDCDGSLASECCGNSWRLCMSAGGESVGVTHPGLWDPKAVGLQALVLGVGGVCTMQFSP